VIGLSRIARTRSAKISTLPTDSMIAPISLAFCNCFQIQLQKTSEIAVCGTMLHDTKRRSDCPLNVSLEIFGDRCA
jgi:hypothetical protein